MRKIQCNWNLRAGTSRTMGPFRATAGSLLSMILLGSFNWIGVRAQAQQMTLTRNNATVLVGAYAPNIGRVSLSLRIDDAVAASGYGIIAKPLADGWTGETTQA